MQNCTASLPAFVRFGLCTRKASPTRIELSPQPVYSEPTDAHSVCNRPAAAWTPNELARQIRKSIECEILQPKLANMIATAQIPQLDKYSESQMTGKQMAQ